MRRYGTLFTRFWEDEYVSQLSDRAKLLFIFLLEGIHTNSAGCFRMPQKYLSADLGWSVEDVETYLDELINAKPEDPMVLYCTKTSWVLIPKFIKYNPIPNPNVGKSLTSPLSNVPDAFSYFPELAKCLAPSKERLESGIYNKILAKAAKGSTNGSSNGSANGSGNIEIEMEMEIEEEPTSSLPDDPPPSDDEIPSDEKSDQAEAKQQPEDEKQEGSPEQKSLTLTESGLVLDAGGEVRCPHDKIIQLYHHYLPTCPKVRVWNEPNRKALKARWREDKERQSLQWWKEFFEYVAQSDFLTGKAKEWTCTLGWLVKPTNFGKVLNGQYENRGNANLAQGATTGGRPDHVTLVHQWAKEDPGSWLRHEIATGMSLLLADNRAPYGFNAINTAMLIERKLLSTKQAQTEEVDAPRIRMGFMKSLELKGWPSVQDLLSLLPARKGQVSIRHEVSSEDKQKAANGLAQMYAAAGIRAS